jgi:hypothetical protein
VTNMNVVSKRQVCLISTRSRHWSIDGDCVLRHKHTCGSDFMMDLKDTIRPHGQSPLRSGAATSESGSCHAEAGLLVLSQGNPLPE